MQRMVRLFGIFLAYTATAIAVDQLPVETLLRYPRNQAGNLHPVDQLFLGFFDTNVGDPVKFIELTAKKSRQSDENLAFRKYVAHYVSFFSEFRDRYDRNHAGWAERGLRLKHIYAAVKGEMGTHDSAMIALQFALDQIPASQPEWLPASDLWADYLLTPADELAPIQSESEKQKLLDLLASGTNATRPDMLVKSALRVTYESLARLRESHPTDDEQYYVIRRTLGEAFANLDKASNVSPRELLAVVHFLQQKNVAWGLQARILRKLVQLPMDEFQFDEVVAFLLLPVTDAEKRGEIFTKLVMTSPMYLAFPELIGLAKNAMARVKRSTANSDPQLMNGFKFQAAGNVISAIVHYLEKSSQPDVAWEVLQIPIIAENESYIAYPRRQFLKVHPEFAPKPVKVVKGTKLAGVADIFNLASVVSEAFGTNGALGPTETISFVPAQVPNGVFTIQSPLATESAVAYEMPPAFPVGQTHPSVTLGAQMPTAPSFTLEQLIRLYQIDEPTESEFHFFVESFGAAGIPSELASTFLLELIDKSGTNPLKASEQKAVGECLGVVKGVNKINLSDPYTAFFNAIGTTTALDLSFADLTDPAIRRLYLAYQVAVADEKNLLRIAQHLERLKQHPELRAVAYKRILLTRETNRASVAALAPLLWMFEGFDSGAAHEDVLRWLLKQKEIRKTDWFSKFFEPLIRAAREEYFTATILYKEQIQTLVRGVIDMIQGDQTIVRAWQKSPLWGSEFWQISFDGTIQLHFRDNAQPVPTPKPTRVARSLFSVRNCAAAVVTATVVGLGLWAHHEFGETPPQEIPAGEVEEPAPTPGAMKNVFEVRGKELLN